MNKNNIIYLHRTTAQKIIDHKQLTRLIAELFQKIYSLQNFNLRLLPLPRSFSWALRRLLRCSAVPGRRPAGPCPPPSQSSPHLWRHRRRWQCRCRRTDRWPPSLVWRPPDWLRWATPRRISVEFKNTNINVSSA